MSDRSFIEMFSGTMFSFNNPQVDDVKLIDIAWHLSNTCRFFGGTDSFYSVAQHCVLASMVSSPQAALACLMHDTAEAYVGDNATPLKGIIPVLAILEQAIFTVICERFDFAFSDNVIKEVKSIDRQMLATERIQLTRNHENEWDCLKGVQLLDINIRPWSPYEARRRFLERFQVLASTNLTPEIHEAFIELHRS